VLVNPTDAENYQSTLREVEAAAGELQILVHEVATVQQIDTAFASMASEKPGDAPRHEIASGDGAPAAPRATGETSG